MSATIGVRTFDGRPLGQVHVDETTDLSWTRERNEISRCEITTYDLDAADLLPWFHWVDIWEDDAPVWTGPIQECGTDRMTRETRIEVRDVSVYAWYTRTPVTRQWSNLDPAPIAADLWDAMLELHQISATPDVLPPTIRDRFDFSTTADAKMLNQTLADLVQLGLDWTVVAGRPILGTPTTDPVAELDEHDFMAALRRVRSGKRTASDVRVQGKNWSHTERVAMQGLRLQALRSLDDLAGVSNITSAARQYLQQVGSLRDVLEVPMGASLSPDAPIATGELVPGYVLTVYAEPLSTLMRLKSVEVAYSGGSRDVRVTLDAITEPIELAPDDGGF